MTISNIAKSGLLSKLLSKFSVPFESRESKVGKIVEEKEKRIFNNFICEETKHTNEDATNRPTNNSRLKLSSFDLPRRKVEEEEEALPE